VTIFHVKWHTESTPRYVSLVLITATVESSHVAREAVISSLSRKVVGVGGMILAGGGGGVGGSLT